MLGKPEMIYKIVQILGFVSITMCCDCAYTEWSWRPCVSWAESTLKMALDMPSFGENCETYRLKGVTLHNRHNMTSAKVTAEGTIAGFPLMYSDPYACMAQPARTDTDYNEDSEKSALIQIVFTLCSELTGKTFDIVTPLNPTEREVIESIAGTANIRIEITEINGDPSKSDCYDFMGTLECKEDDSE